MLLPTVNNAASNTAVQINILALAFNSFGYILRSRISGSYGNFVLFCFWGITILFYIVATLFPPAMHKSFNFSTPLPTIALTLLVSLGFLNNSQSDGVWGGTSL